MENSLTLSEMQQNKKQEIFQDSLDCMELIAEKFVGQRLNYIQKILSGVSGNPQNTILTMNSPVVDFMILRKRYCAGIIIILNLNLSDC